MITLALLFLVGSPPAFAEQNAGSNRLEAARREFEDGKLDSATAILNDLEQHGGRDAKSLDLRGCVLMEQGKYDEAIQTFDAAREADPKVPARLHTGDVLWRQHKWDEARIAYQTASKESDILVINERLRYATFMTYLGQKDEAEAREALARIPFPTETAAYYYAQAAWSFAHDNKRDGNAWVDRAKDIYKPRMTAWFARFLYDFGWLKTKPPLSD